jgi:hypothetical protein
VLVTARRNAPAIQPSFFADVDRTRSCCFVGVDRMSWSTLANPRDSGQDVVEALNISGFAMKSLLDIDGVKSTEDELEGC